MTKLITAYQKIKQDVYNEKDLFLKDIGQPIFFKKEFILIHFESQNFVTFNMKTSKLILTENYSDECIFLFWPWSSLDNNVKNVFSNQNLYICKKEKNLWSNNHYLNVKMNTSKGYSESNINNQNINITNNAINNVTNNNIINDSAKFDIDRGTRMQKSSFKSKQNILESKWKEDQSRIDNNFINTNNNINFNNNFNNINNLNQFNPFNNYISYNSFK